MRRLLTLLLLFMPVIALGQTHGPPMIVTDNPPAAGSDCSGAPLLTYKQRLTGNEHYCSGGLIAIRTPSGGSGDVNAADPETITGFWDFEGAKKWSDLDYILEDPDGDDTPERVVFHDADQDGDADCDDWGAAMQLLVNSASTVNDTFTADLNGDATPETLYRAGTLAPRGYFECPSVKAATLAAAGVSLNYANFQNFVIDGGSSAETFLVSGVTADDLFSKQDLSQDMSSNTSLLQVGDYATPGTVDNFEIRNLTLIGTSGHYRMDLCESSFAADPTFTGEDCLTDPDNDGSADGVQHTLLITRAENALIENVRVYNADRIMVFIDETPGYETQTDIHNLWTGGNATEHCVVTESGGIGVYDSHLEGCGGYSEWGNGKALEVWCGSNTWSEGELNNVRFRGNTVRRTDHGIFVFGAGCSGTWHHIDVSHNTFEDVAASPIWIQVDDGASGNEDATQINVESNQMRDLVIATPAIYVRRLDDAHTLEQTVISKNNLDLDARDADADRDGTPDNPVDLTGIYYRGDAGILSQNIVKISADTTKTTFEEIGVYVNRAENILLDTNTVICDGNADGCVAYMINGVNTVKAEGNLALFPTAATLAAEPLYAFHLVDPAGWTNERLVLSHNVFRYPASAQGAQFGIRNESAVSDSTIEFNQQFGGDVFLDINEGGTSFESGLIRGNRGFGLTSYLIQGDGSATVSFSHEDNSCVGCSTAGSGVGGGIMTADYARGGWRHQCDEDGDGTLEIPCTFELFDGTRICGAGTNDTDCDGLIEYRDAVTFFKHDLTASLSNSTMKHPFMNRGLEGMDRWRFGQDVTVEKLVCYASGSEADGTVTFTAYDGTGTLSTDRLLQVTATGYTSYETLVDETVENGGTVTMTPLATTALGLIVKIDTDALWDTTEIDAYCEVFYVWEE